MEILKNKVGSYKFKPSQNNSKGTLVFIHGFAANSDYHDEIGEKFDAYDYYTLELPGHGYTEINQKKVFYLDLFVDYCIAMITELGLDNIILIGHSMGGSLAMRVSNLISHKIEKLILVTPMNSSITPYALRVFFLFTPKTFNKTLALNNVLYKDLTKTLDLNVENYISKEHKYQVKHINFFRKLKRNLYSFKNLKTCFKAEKILKTPTLLILGQFDKTINYKFAIRAIKKANKPFIQVSIFKKSSHIPFQEEEQKYFKEITDFIE